MKRVFTKFMYGTCDDEGLFYVAMSNEGDMALTLHVRQASDESLRRGARLFEPYSLSTHIPFPLEPEGVARPEPGKSLCEWISGPCWTSYDSCLDAAEFWKKYAQPQREQNEAFWLALEAKAKKLFALALAHKPDVVRCNHCDGLGYVRNQPKP